MPTAMGNEGEASAEQSVEALLEEEPPEADAAEAPGASGAPLVPAGEPKALARRQPDRLARRDPLQLYMDAVNRYPLLSPEEEHELAVRYREHGDLEAARRLVLSNLRLVVKIAYDYRRAYRNLLDLVQEGNIGLMQAVKKYDPYRGVKLSSYAAWWIRAYILRYILNNWRLVKVGTTQAQRKLFFNLQKEKARLQAMGIEPTPERIAERLDVSPEEVASMDRRLGASEVSLDAPVGSPEGRPVTRAELLPSPGESIDEIVADMEVDERVQREIRAFGETLEGKEKVIFEQRLLAQEPRTLADLGKEFGVSRERVRQLEKRLVRKLREHLREKLGQELFDVAASP